MIKGLYVEFSLNYTSEQREDRYFKSMLYQTGEPMYACKVKQIICSLHGNCLPNQS